MRVALVQFNAGVNKQDNINRAYDAVKRALAKDAQFVLLPEVFHWRGDTRSPLHVTAAESIPGESTAPFLKLALKHKAAILLGSIFERIPNKYKLYNTSILINDQGCVEAKYRKIHLFHARLNDKIIREQDCFTPGRRKILAKVKEFQVGLSICYDLRFPHLYRAYAASGVNVFTVPSCFTKKTGLAHWEILVRARAIENLCYVLAPNQVGSDARGMEAYGNSMIVSPWGDVIARGSATREEIIYGDLDLQRIKEARIKLPGIIEER